MCVVFGCPMVYNLEGGGSKKTPPTWNKLKNSQNRVNYLHNSNEFGIVLLFTVEMRLNDFLSYCWAFIRDTVRGI